jgi:DNA-binding beta-propeller fold protein YncE
MAPRRLLGMLCWACLFASSLLLLCPVAMHAAPQGSGYHVVRRMPVGGDGSWDYLTIDPDAHRIYLSRSTHTMIVDEIGGKVIGDLADTKGVHGIALAPELGKGYTSNGGEAMVTVFDLKTMQPTTKIKTTGNGPDSIIYDPMTKRVFTFNGQSANSTAIDATTGQVAGTVTLTGKPETPVLDGKGSIFVNIEDKNQLIEFDTKSLAVKNTWSIEPCTSPSGIAMDRVHRRLFLGCDNKIMGIVNADTGKMVATPAMCDGVDANGFDPSSGLAFASCREGVLSVIHEDSPDKYSVVANVNTQAGARTMALDPKTHHVFVVTADFSAAAAPTADNPRPRPQMIPNSFVILELAP